MGACTARSKPGPTEPQPRQERQSSSGVVAMGSMLDMRMQPNRPKKCRVMCGAAAALSGMVGAISLKGMKKGQKAVPNQDSWSVHRFDDSVLVFSVFDGHGDVGHEISNRMRSTFHDILMKQQKNPVPCCKEFLRSAFAELESRAEACQGSNLSGTTATVVVFDARNGTLTAGHVGDSTAVLGRREPNSSTQPKAERLTRDHDPGDEAEQARICSSGGVVKLDGVHRVYKKGTRAPGLNLSRTLGDEYAHRHCGVIAEPEVSEVEICAEEDQMLLVCSDGVWGVFSPEEAVSFVQGYAAFDAAEAARALAAEAWKRWDEGTSGKYVDDITALLVNLNSLTLGYSETQSTLDTLSLGEGSLSSFSDTSN